MSGSLTYMKFEICLKEKKYMHMWLIIDLEIARYQICVFRQTKPYLVRQLSDDVHLSFIFITFARGDTVAVVVPLIYILALATNILEIQANQ